jgi:hypothetical protein
MEFRSRQPELCRHRTARRRRPHLLLRQVDD